MGCELFKELTRRAEGGLTIPELEEFGTIIQASLDQNECPLSELTLVDQQIGRTINKFIELEKVVPDYRFQMGGMGPAGYDYLIDARDIVSSPYYRLHEKVTLARAGASAQSSDISLWSLAPAGVGVIFGVTTLVCHNKLTRDGFRLCLFISAALIIGSIGFCKE